jgi:L-lactate dehydrogenase
MSKITIIGAGNVGATLAYTLVANGTSSDIVLMDIKKEKALGEEMDIFQGTPFCPPVSIRVGDYEDAAGSDIVLITCGVGRKPGQSRLDLTHTNVEIIKDIAPKITKYAPDAKYIIISNPVDILTYVFTKVSGLPERQIIGSGTILDTSRLRARLAQCLGVSQKNIHAYVFGEHGETAFVAWSLATVGSISLDYYLSSIHDKAEMSGLVPFNQADIEEYVRTSGSKIIAAKGATFNAITICALHIIQSIYGNQNAMLPVSSMLHGEYGIEDVCLSLLSIVDRSGLKTHIIPPLTTEEIDLLHKSANSLKDVIRQLNI